METIITQSSPISKQNASLSEQIIPTVPGEFYSYTSDFSIERPLYILMKCKANKSRPITPEIIKELDFTFIFGREVILCSPDSELSKELLGNIIVEPQELIHSEIRNANITEDTFYECFQEKRDSFLVNIYNNSGESKSNLVLYTGLILSVKTFSGKYGLIIIKELTDSTCKIDACHILLI